MSKLKLGFFVIMLTSIFILMFTCVDNSLKADNIAINSWYTWYDIPNGLDTYQGTEYTFNGSLREPINIQTTTEINGDYVTRGNWVYQITGLTIGSQGMDYNFSFVDSLTGDIMTTDIQVLSFNNGWLTDNFKVIWLSSYDNSINDNNAFDTFLNSFGVFGIRQELPNSSFSDLLFTYVDIIPRVTQSMTSFEILGFSLFAILGTFILILLIVKILKGGFL